MTSYTITRADLAGRPLILAIGPGGPVHLRWTGPSSAHEIYVPGHAPTGAEWEFDTVTTQQLITALLSTAHS
jgi:hypothetical protein